MSPAKILLPLAYCQKLHDHGRWLPRDVRILCSNFALQARNNYDFLYLGLYASSSPDDNRSYFLAFAAVEDDLSRNQLALTEYTSFLGLSIKFNR
jgi:hypothetical protein